MYQEPLAQQTTKLTFFLWSENGAYAFPLNGIEISTLSETSFSF
jgi:hypothetical protein